MELKIGEKSKNGSGWQLCKSFEELGYPSRIPRHFGRILIDLIITRYIRPLESETDYKKYFAYELLRSFLKNQDIHSDLAPFLTDP
jgi:hypothetical protein